MKTWKFFVCFSGLMALCVVVGMGFLMAGDSGSRGDALQNSFRENSEVKVLISVNIQGEIVLNVTYPQHHPDHPPWISPPGVIWAQNQHWIEWTTDPSSNILDFEIFFGDSSPMGNDGGNKFYKRLKPDTGLNPGIKKSAAGKVHHDSRFTGERVVKYIVVVVYQDPNNLGEGRIIMIDPEIIIPPRGGSGK